MDNFLIYLIQSHNIDALQILVEKYRKTIKKWADEQLKVSSYNHFIDYQVIYSELDIILYKAIETYDPSKGVFYSYLRGAVFNSIMNYLRVNTKNKNGIIYLSSELDEDIILEDSLSSYDNLSRISERYNVLEEVEKFMMKIQKFTEDEQKIIYLKMQGFTSEEIENMTDINVRKVNYIFRKIKKM